MSDEHDETPESATTPTGSPTSSEGVPLSGPSATGERRDRDSEDQGADEPAG